MKTKYKHDTHNVYKDILLLFEFFGNDFIPAMKNIQIDEYNLDILLFSYIILLKEYEKTLFTYIE